MPSALWITSFRLIGFSYIYICRWHSHRPPSAPTTIVSKFTLHSSSLPKPQTAVPISLAPRTTMDAKSAKQVANQSRRGFHAKRDISSDSGFGGSIASSNSRYGFDTTQRKSPQRQRQRARNLEMVFDGRHKFHVRDLSGTSSSTVDDNVMLLALPELPSAFDSTSQPVNLRWAIDEFC